MNRKVIFLLHDWTIDDSSPYPVAWAAGSPVWGLCHVVRLIKADEISVPLFGPVFNSRGLANLLPKWWGVN